MARWPSPPAGSSPSARRPKFAAIIPMPKSRIWATRSSSPAWSTPTPTWNSATARPAHPRKANLPTGWWTCSAATRLSADELTRRVQQAIPLGHRPMPSIRRHHPRRHHTPMHAHPPDAPPISPAHRQLWRNRRHGPTPHIAGGTTGVSRRRHRCHRPPAHRHLAACPLLGRARWLSPLPGRNQSAPSPPGHASGRILGRGPLPSPSIAARSATSGMPGSPGMTTSPALPAGPFAWLKPSVCSTTPHSSPTSTTATTRKCP